MNGCASTATASYAPSLVRRCTGVFIALLCGASGAIAHAEGTGATSLAVFPVAVGRGDLRELAAALDPVLMSKLQELPQVRVAARPALDLAATQLAMDCVGQTRDCLRLVATQSGVDGLIAPSLQVAGAETVVTLLYFDARGRGDMHSATRRYPGRSAEREALDGLGAMVRQLFELPEPLPGTGSVGPTSATPLDVSLPTDFESPRRATAWPALPVTLTACGVAFLGAGIGLGLASHASSDAYAKVQIDTVSDATAAMLNADRAEKTFKQARTEALLANIAFGVGGAALATGVTLWTLHLTKRSPSRDGLALSPVLTPTQVGVSARGLLPSL